MLIMAIPGIVEDWEGTRGEGQVDRLQHWRWKKCERWSSIIVSAAKFQLYVQILDPWTRMKRVCWFLSVPHWSWQIQEEGLGEPGSTWYLVLGTWYFVLGTLYLALCTWHLAVLGTWVSLTDPGTSNPKKRVSDSQARKLARAVKMFLFFLILNEPALKPF